MILKEFIYAAMVGFPLVSFAADTVTTVTVPVVTHCEVANDEAQMQLVITKTGADLPALTRSVSQSMAQGLNDLRATRIAVQMKTTQMSTYPQYTKSGNKNSITGWEIRYAVRLSHIATQDLPRLMQVASKTFAIDSVSFSVSQKQKSKYHQEMTATLLRQVRESASMIASEMGLKSVQIKTIVFDNAVDASAYHAVTARLKSNYADSMMPQLESGESTLSLQATATIEIK